ncbi:hypothetical protein [Tenggerimyces flavus]|uniref:Thiamine-binding protein domain-containing protein n=1 Tax=Tenggerimyces flavus TaxID=1708749 RepID=A0ABV7Y3F2_9ACTN|nr:hypothetical protein [Tenggerimyces flavus]MBM7788667.1 hypothetical protein [Tenggerimyces flavus]
MVEIEVTFPEDLDGYEGIIESKGCLFGVRAVVDGVVHEVTVYDEVRLMQELRDELQARGSSLIVKMLVVPRVTREEIVQAIRRFARSGFAGSI